MNRYLVGWNDDALDELTHLWLQANNPREVTDAQAQIDQLLARGPLQHGQEISEGLYRLILPPLRVLFTVDQGHFRVEVLSVKPVG